jgi:hypothetical protein
MFVVVGGHSRNIGKTSVVEGLIRRIPEAQWTALKITQFGHGVCSHSGSACGCEPAEPDHPCALSEEYEPGESDSARFKAAGATRSFWLRTRTGQLAGARRELERILAAGPNTIVESNSILELAHPDLYIVVLDFGCEDFKPSALRYMDRADAFVVIDRGINVPMWKDVSRGLWDAKPQFRARPPYYVSAALSGFVKRRLSG